MAVDAGSIYSSVRVHLDKLKGDVKAVESLLDQIGKSSEKNAKQTQDSFESAFDATKLAGVAAFAAITMAMKQSIKVAGDYEQSIANVQSVVMGTEKVFDELNRAAKLAGETTRFTASQSADALYNLAQGGLTAQESISALDGVLMLAGSTQASLTDASALTVATLNQFSMSADQATRISNVFAASISSSMANMEKLTSGMRQAGPIASAMNLTFEETVAVLNAMYDAGYQGEQAGTAFRSMLAFLSSEADPTTRKLLALGLTFDQINPAANSFADIIDNIAKSGITAGEVMDAFGTRAGAQMLTLLRVGRDGLQEYENAITDTSAASEMYAIQNDTLAGSLDRLKSAAQSAQIEFVEQFTPIMRSFLEILTAITVQVARLPGPLKIFFGILLAGIPVVIGLTTAVTALSVAMKSVSGPIGWVVAGVAGLTAGFSALNDKYQELQTKRAEEEFGELAETLGMTARELKELNDRAEDFGMDIDSYRSFVDVLRLSSTEMFTLGQMMNQVRLSHESVLPLMERWAEVLGISFEQMVRLMNASSAVSEADRVLLQGIIDNIDAEKAYLAQTEERIKTEEELMLEAKVARVNELNERIKGMKAEGDEQQELFDIYDATLSEIDRKQRLGVINEKEALEEKKKASDALIKALLAQETQWIDNDKVIMDAVASGNEYTAAVKALEDAEKAEADAAEERRKILEEIAEEEKRAIEQLEELGATEAQLAEIQRGRRIAAIELMEVEQEEKDAAIAAVNAYYDGYVAMLEAQDQLAKDDALRNALKMQAKLIDEVGKKGEELLEVRRAHAIEEAKSSGASEELINARIDQINEYYDAMIDEEKNKAFTKAEEERMKALEKEAQEAERARKKAEADIESYQHKLEDLGATELGLIELQRERALVGAEGNDQLIESINAYYDALADESAVKAALATEKERAKIAADQAKIDEAQTNSAEAYRQKLEDLQATEEDLIELQRARAIAAAEASGANDEAIEENIIAINAYYDALRDTEPERDMVAKTKQMATEIKKIWDGLSGSLASLFSAIYEDRLDNLERELEAELEAAGLSDESAKERAERALEDAREKNEEEIALIQRRLQAAQEAGDEESALLLQQQVDEMRATHEEVEREKQKAIDKTTVEEDYEERRKKIQFEAAMVGWRIQMAQAVADAAMLSMSGFLTKPFIPAGMAAGALATTQGALQVAAVTMAKPKLATGGIVLPRMGGTDVTLAENAYPELALNAGPSGQDLMAIFAKQIVDHMQGSAGGGTIVVNLQVDRKTLSTIVVDDINNGRVRLNR